MSKPPELIHVYCMPGMSAKPNIFEFIELPEDKYRIHWLSWIPPENKEPIEAYSKRIAEKVVHQNVILIGVSLGGVVIQEMQKFIKVKQLILISSIKTKYELPGFMKFSKKFKLYKLLPTGLAKHYGLLYKLPIGRKTKRRLKLYDHYLGFFDKAYINWGIDQLLNWDREEPLPKIIHIHGDRDKMFPIKYIDNCVVLKGGSHVMIITRYRWFNKHLPSLIEEQLLVN
ncbi:MAG TPA: alpha/beta hydrolase [Flavobacteriaceae bacterium]|nr:alpha/beta hydrolase [Flavobacteriaceae bacterium]